LLGPTLTPAIVMDSFDELGVLRNHSVVCNPDAPYIIEEATITMICPELVECIVPRYEASLYNASDNADNSTTPRLLAQATLAPEEGFVVRNASYTDYVKLNYTLAGQKVVSNTIEGFHKRILEKTEDDYPYRWGDAYYGKFANAISLPFWGIFLFFKLAVIFIVVCCIVMFALCATVCFCQYLSQKLRALSLWAQNKRKQVWEKRAERSKEQEKAPLVTEV